MRGFFITLEGIDGCGKSTQARLLARWLRSKGFSVLCTDEPTNGPIGKIIEKILDGRLSVPIETEVCLFAADRAWHLANVVFPALEAGRVVINERYVDSSIAYQTAKGASPDFVRRMNEFALPPDLAILVDVPAEVALSRIKKARKLDEFEKDLELQKRVRQNYLKLARRERLKLVDGRRPPKEVQPEIQRLAEALIRRRRYREGPTRVG